MSKLLGKQCRDVITGFEGVAVAYAEHLTGCATYGLSPKVDDKGMIQDTVYFDVARLEVVGNGPKLNGGNGPKLNDEAPASDRGGSSRDAPGRSA